MKLQKGYDWLCVCGESNYADEDIFCCNCDKQRSIGEVKPDSDTSTQQASGSENKNEG